MVDATVCGASLTITMEQCASVLAFTTSEPPFGGDRPPFRDSNSVCMRLLVMLRCNETYRVPYGVLEADAPSSQI